MEPGADHRTHNASEIIWVGDRDTTGSCNDGHQERAEQDGNLDGRQNGADEFDKEDDEENAVASARG